MTLFRNFFSCVRGHRSHAHRRISSSQTKIKFGEPLQRSSKTESHLPPPIFRLIIFLAHEGIQTNDLFRRPGNINHMNVIIKLLAQGKPVQWNKYNLYTCANVAKKYLLNLPGGLFGRKGESILLATLDWTEDARISEFLILLREMVPATQELTILIFGILFRMVTYSVNVQSLYRDSPPESAQNLTEPLPGSGTPQSTYPRSPTEQSIESQSLINRQTVLAEAVAKSVAGSLFHSCRDSPDKVERAAKVLEHLILAFPSFDPEFIDFFDDAMNQLSTHSTLSTISSHDMSISGSSRIVRKPSGLAASLEIWSESFGKNASQRSSLKDTERVRYERSESEIRRVSQVLHHNVSINIPSITITSPHGEVNAPDSPDNDYRERLVFGRDVISAKIADVTANRHFQARLQSMKRRHLANLKKRSDWFLNSSPVPASPIFRIDNDYNSVVVVTCGGSSICLGQAQPIASGNRCIMVHTNNTAHMSSYFASSGPDILQSTMAGQSRPETPDYSMMSRAMEGDEDEEEESYCSSLSGDNARMYGAAEARPAGVSSTADIDHQEIVAAEVEAPNSVPLIRRMLPSRSSTASRKTSVQQQPGGDCAAQIYLRSPGRNQDDIDDDDDEEEDFLLDDTQSDCY